jgi:hypothetical protein
LAGLAALLLATLLTGLSTTTAQWLRADKSAAQAVAALENEREAREQTHRLLYVADMNAARQAWNENHPDRVMDLLQRHDHRVGQQADLRGFEWYYLWRALSKNASERTIRHHDLVREVAVSPDGTTLAACDTYGNVFVWGISAEKPKIVHAFDDSSERKFAGVNFLAFSPDGRQLACPRETGVLLRDLARGDENVIHNETGVIRTFSYAPDGKSALVGGFTARASQPLAEIWSLPDCQLVEEMKGHSSGILSSDFSPSGRLVATAGREIVIWDAATAQIVHKLDDDMPLTLSAAVTERSRYGT